MWGTRRCVYRYTLAICFILISFHNQTAHADLGRGQALFKLCTSCHGDNGEGQKNLEAPAIAGLPLWYTQNQITKFKNGARGKHPNDLAGMRMRPMARTLQTPEDIEAVSKYVAGLPRTQPKPTIQGDATAGKAMYAICTACHGPDGAGVEALNAPPLKGMSDWYMFTQIKNFKAGIRGDAKVDPIGATMAPMAQTLPDDQAIKDVISYINSL